MYLGRWGKEEREGILCHKSGNFFRGPYSEKYLGERPRRKMGEADRIMDFGEIGKDQKRPAQEAGFLVVKSKNRLYKGAEWVSVVFDQNAYWW